MVGQARLELALSERTGFTVRCGTNYALLTHIWQGFCVLFWNTPVFGGYLGKSANSHCVFGGTGWLRSSDAQGFNLPLYQLSYDSIWRKWRDSNSQAVARGGFLDRCFANYKTLAGKAHYVSGGMKGPSFDIS